MKKYEKLYQKEISKGNIRAYKKDRIIYRFKDVGIEFLTEMLLWQQSNGGIDFGEIWAATANINKKDKQNWDREFTALGERVEKMAWDALERGHPVSAREAFFKASCYYGSAEKREKQIGCFRSAGKLLNPSLEPVTIPFEDKFLPGYFVKANTDDCKHKTLIFIGGGDTIVEDLYFIIAPAAVKRGYNVFLVELPGQGATILEGMIQRPDTEVPMKTVVDYLLNRSDVDEKKLAAMGVSWGGYMVPRAACYEKRIKAIIANPIILDGYIWMSRISRFDIIARLEGTILFPLISLFFGGSTTIERLKDLKKKWGVKSMQKLVEINKNFYFDPRKIECPTLLLDGELESKHFPGVRIFQELALEDISHSQKKRITGPKELGAGGHCQMINSRFMAQVTFDWLDEVFCED